MPNVIYSLTAWYVDFMERRRLRWKNRKALRTRETLVPRESPDGICLRCGSYPVSTGNGFKAKRAAELGFCVTCYNGGKHARERMALVNRGGVYKRSAFAEKIAKVIELHEVGCTSRQIGRVMGISPNTIRTWLGRVAKGA